MHRIRLSFRCGAYRVIEFDELHVNGEFTIFNAGDQTVMTAVTQNLCFFEPAPPETIRQEFSQGELLGKR